MVNCSTSSKYCILYRLKENTNDDWKYHRVASHRMSIMMFNTKKQARTEIDTWTQPEVWDIQIAKIGVWLESPIPLEKL